MLLPEGQKFEEWETSKKAVFYPKSGNIT